MNFNLIQPYQEKWPNDFLLIKEKLMAALANLTLRIEHVGSTAVPELAAKPILDIDIIYDESASWENIKLRLESVGYYHNGDQGITGREVFKRKNQGIKNAILDEIKHHLYVCSHKSEEWKRHLKFRDYLRVNEEAKNQYQTLKYEIAALANQDQKEYARLKEIMAGDFIRAILE